MLEAALKLATAPQTFGDDDVQSLLAQGFSRDDVWDIGAITGLFALSNRLAHLSDMQPNPEFFTLGRDAGRCPAQAPGAALAGWT
jgi:alkylhydroperoxidase family enzyme